MNSRRPRWFQFSAALVLSWTLSCVSAQAISDAELQRIGKRIWQNECGGTVEGLTSWNTGENFASLGIGHFIWYPAGVEGPFEESFPKLIKWYQQRGVDLPGWLAATKDCPWPDRASFSRDHDGTRQKDLRKLLASTINEQTLFIIDRLDQATPRLVKAAGKNGALVQHNVTLLRQTAAGNFALIDYVNFKGEGLNPKERYKDEGWGLLQVLMNMRPEDAASAPGAFAASSQQVLARRVANSPAERGEKRWLPGWSNRCAAYAR
ncbi:MAG TPA: hypothetical protein VLE43_08420 [Candidatus Saccharimonadia bacterium]|nr:hypothetical protein [Candidatus Saccharimonadia bacterium]